MIEPTYCDECGRPYATCPHLPPGMVRELARLLAQSHASERTDYALVAQAVRAVSEAAFGKHADEVERLGDAMLQTAAKLCEAWPLIEELVAEIIDIAHPSSDAYKVAVRLRKAVSP